MAIDERFMSVPKGTIAAIVTVLEMREAAAARPQHADPSWTIETVERPDPDFYLDLYRRVGAPHLWYSRLEMERERLDALLHDPKVRLDVLRVEGRAEGLLEFDFRDDNVCEIAFFGVTPALVGTGAARVMMNRAIRVAFEQPIERLWVHTNSIDHPKALDFYRRSGFTPVERHIEMAQDPRLNGLLPRDCAPHIPIV